MCQLQVWLEGGENSKRSSPQWQKQNPEGRDGVLNLRETRSQVEILTAWRVQEAMETAPRAGQRKRCGKKLDHYNGVIAINSIALILATSPSEGCRTCLAGHRGH